MNTIFVLHSVHCVKIVFVSENQSLCSRRRLPASPTPSTARTNVDIYPKFMSTVAATAMMMVVMMVALTSPFTTHDVPFDAALDLPLGSVQQHLSTNGRRCSTKRT